MFLLYEIQIIEEYSSPIQTTIATNTTKMCIRILYLYAGTVHTVLYETYTKTSYYVPYDNFLKTLKAVGYKIERKKKLKNEKNRNSKFYDIFHRFVYTRTVLHMNILHLNVMKWLCIVYEIKFIYYIINIVVVEYAAEF